MPGLGNEQWSTNVTMKTGQKVILFEILNPKTSFCSESLKKKVYNYMQKYMQLYAEITGRIKENVIIHIFNFGTKLIHHAVAYNGQTKQRPLRPFTSTWMKKVRWLLSPVAEQRLVIGNTLCFHVVSMVISKNKLGTTSVLV